MSHKYSKTHLNALTFLFALGYKKRTIQFVFWKISVNLRTQNNNVKTKSYKEFIPFAIKASKQLIIQLEKKIPWKKEFTQRTTD